MQTPLRWPAISSRQLRGVHAAEQKLADSLNISVAQL
jgi:hypothetical protein